MPTLLEILDSNKIVLVDSSLHSPIGPNLGKKTYGTRSFSALDKNFLMNEINMSLGFINILEHPNSRTIHNVTQELKEYLDIIAQKLICFSENEFADYFIKGRKQKSPFKRHEKLEYEISKRVLFKEIQEASFRAYNLSRTKELEFDNPAYNNLVEIIKLLSRELNLKNDTSHNYLIPFKNPYERDTDEKMLSTLYWMSISSDENTSLISNDGDFIRLFSCFRVLGAREFSPYNELFVESIRKNPPKLYLPKLDNYKIGMDTDCREIPIDLGHVNGVYGKLPINTELKRKIHLLWERFSEN